jgi:hypothetical protein
METSIERRGHGNTERVKLGEEEVNRDLVGKTGVFDH